MRWRRKLASHVSAKMTPRRFPPPWAIEEHNQACYIVKDAGGQALGYFYFEDEPGRRSAANLLSRDVGDGGELRQVARVSTPHSKRKGRRLRRPSSSRPLGLPIGDCRSIPTKTGSSLSRPIAVAKGRRSTLPHSDEAVIWSRTTREVCMRRSIVAIVVATTIFASGMHAQRVSAMTFATPVQLGATANADVLREAAWHRHYRRWSFPHFHFWVRPPWFWGHHWRRWHRFHHHHDRAPSIQNNTPDKPGDPDIGRPR
jgi:hypothetical protein